MLRYCNDIKNVGTQDVEYRKSLSFIGGIFFFFFFLHGGAAMFTESVTLTLPGPDLS